MIFRQGYFILSYCHEFKMHIVRDYIFLHSSLVTKDVPLLIVSMYKYIYIYK